MANNTDEKRLARELEEAHEQRTAAIAQIKAQTAKLLAEQRKARKAAALEQQQLLSEYASELQHDTADWLKDARRDRAEMAQMQRTQLQHFTQDLHTDTSTLLHDIEAARQSMSALQRADLDQYVADLHQTMTHMRRELRQWHQTMAHEQSKELAAYITRLHEEVDDFLSALNRDHTTLRRDMIAWLTELRQARQSFNREQQQYLAEYTTTLHNEVQTLLDMYGTDRSQMAAAQRHELRQYLNNLKQEVAAWLSESSLDGVERKVVTLPSEPAPPQPKPTPRPEAAPPAPKPEPKPAPPAPTLEASSPPPTPPAPKPASLEDELTAELMGEDDEPDRLTAIRGIGPKTQQRLNEEGIYTYEQLAQVPPEELLQILYPSTHAGGTAEDIRQTLDDMVRLNKVQEWIDEAQKLKDED